MNKVLILRTAHLDDVVEHLTAMGLVFVREQHVTDHETGVVHYACEVNGRVLEIYPGGPEGRVRFLGE